MVPAMDYEVFKKKIRDKVGLDLNSYKEQQMRRRIHQLMQRYGNDSYESFLSLLDSDPSILTYFTEYLTINTSQFFRDTPVYQHIEKTLLPTLLKKAGPVKIWSAGCSSGAEPYSLVMLLRELAPRGNWQVLATDFDVNILVKAREGKYPENMVSSVPKRYLTRYFTQKDGFFYLDPQIKSSVRFKQQNLLTGRYEEACDLILCRNVFIYFTMETQELLIGRFVQSLRDNGYFIIGCSEMITNSSRFSLQKILPAVYQKIILPRKE